MVVSVAVLEERREAIWWWYREGEGELLVCSVQVREQLEEMGLVCFRFFSEGEEGLLVFVGEGKGLFSVSAGGGVYIDLSAFVLVSRDFFFLFHGRLPLRFSSLLPFSFNLFPSFWLEREEGAAGSAESWLCGAVSAWFCFAWLVRGLKQRDWFAWVVREKLVRLFFLSVRKALSSLFLQLQVVFYRGKREVIYLV